MRILALRALILDTAAATEGVGPVTETLKWGEPAYLTQATGSGSTIRLGWKPAAPSQYAIYFNCNTTLVDEFRGLLDGELRFEGNRAILFQVDDPVPKVAVSMCIAMALTYHLNKKRRGRHRRRVVSA